MHANNHKTHLCAHIHWQGPEVHTRPEGITGCGPRQPNDVFKPSPFLSKCSSSLAWVKGQERSWGRGFGMERHSEALQEPPCAQPGRVFGKCLPGC